MITGFLVKWMSDCSWKLHTLDDLKRMVDEAAATIEEGRVRQDVNSLRRRGSLCVRENDGHFDAGLLVLSTFDVMKRISPVDVIFLLCTVI